MTPDGLIYTVPRDAVTDAELLVPINVAQATSLAVDRAGKVYIADPGNHRIAVLSLGTLPSAAIVSAASYAADRALSANSIAAVFGTNLAAWRTRPMPAAVFTGQFVFAKFESRNSFLNFPFGSYCRNNC